jgi:hypothetical protein
MNRRAIFGCLRGTRVWVVDLPKSAIEGSKASMSLEMPLLSNDFKGLYCDASVFDSFSGLHPICFRRVLPFQTRDELVDDRHLIHAEATHLTARTDDSRRRIVEEYTRCGLLQQADAVHLQEAIAFFGTDFFEMMGLAYANAGMFRCALRWYREVIAELESQNPHLRSDQESVYASVGYGLYSLGLFAEAISWTKSCIGPQPMADALCQAVIAYEVNPSGGVIHAIERSGSRTRYTISAPEPADVGQKVLQLKEALKNLSPFQEVYIDWIRDETPSPGVPAEGYPFKAEVDAGSLVRHKMTLIFAICSQADALREKGYDLEAKRLLAEAAMLEPEAGMVWERLRAF